MKKLVKSSVLFCAAMLAALGTFAQGQFDAIKNMGEGEYRKYEVQGKKGDYKFSYRKDSKVIKVAFKNNDDPRIFSASIDGSDYTLDAPGYAVSLYRGGVKHPELKYLKRPPTEDRHRFVAVGDYLYRLDHYKSADDFRILTVYKKGTLSHMQKVKEEYKALLSMKKENLEQQLMDYLKKETAAQEVAMKKWKAAHPEYYAQLQKDEQTWKKVMNESDWKRHEMEKEWLRRSGSSSASSNDEGDKSDGGGSVQMKISAGSLGKVYIHWKDNGNSKKKVITSSAASTFNVPAGTKLYYSKDGNSQSFFMDAPTSGTGSYKF